MTEEEIKAIQDAKEEAERRASEAEAAAQEARAEADKAKGDVTKVVDELKELRQKKGLESENANINNKEPDLNTLVEQKLAEKEKERRKTELEEALSEFKNSKTEFQNDSAGLVFSKFEEALKKFNFSDVTNKSQAKQRLEEVYRFVNSSTAENDDPNYEGNPRMGNDVPVRENETSKSAESAMQMAKIDKDKFTNLKSKYGEAFASLGIE